MTPSTSALRYEIKFNAHETAFDDMISWLELHPMAFSRCFPDRTVNNVYFDNPSYDSYWENLVGIASRCKMRLRWYGEEQAPCAATMELKFKKARLGWKQSTPIQLPTPQATRLTSESLAAHLREQLDPAGQIHLDLSPLAVLQNKYLRSYYLSADGTIRATIDRDLRFYRCGAMPFAPWREEAVSPQITVMEFKFSGAHIDNAHEAIGQVRYQSTKNSKYVLGVQACLGR